MERATQILGYQAILSDTGRDALKVVADQRPELVLVDINLQDMSGLAFIKKMRVLKEGATIPVVVVSASNEVGKEELVQQAGANGYISKPLSLDKLSDVIKVYLKK